MDHVDTMLQRNTNDIILSQIRSDRCHALSDHVGFVGLRGETLVKGFHKG